MPENETGAELLARIKPQRKEEATNICLRPDLLDAHEDATEALNAQIAADARNARLAGGGVSAKQKKLAQAVKDIEAELDATEVRFVFRSMTKDQWRELCDLHPPRDNNQFDFMVGYNVDAVEDAAVRVCLVSPTFEDCTDAACDHEACGTWQQFIKLINPGEWTELRNTTRSVNRGVMGTPKSPVAAAVLSRAGKGRARPATSE